ncbi:MAG TPA: pilus assembly PilX N-terminal domain-containing protein [Thermoanaerobaculia bacterium]|nr:pilus assembly PilX N-terminal domain-containing protein [Thermoanaerobaculia bacterium]
MRTQRSFSKLRQPRHDRGSALLVSLVVIAGLSLLGLAFVGVSETESAIAANQRDSLQTQAIAEAGARAVVEWFQDPDWARSVELPDGTPAPIMPNNNPPPAGMKRTRVVGTYSGVYKSLGTLLFDRPYRPAPDNRFFGEEDTADITINDDIDPTTMENLNNFLFGDNDIKQGRISDIRIYAPPIVGGTLTGGFWVGGQRFGTATIRVTAQKRSLAGGGISQRVVKIVIGEFPMPIPGGPIQTASNAAFGGAFDVHWGDETALLNLNPAVTRTRLPWANPFQRPSFERGYDAQVFPVNAANPINFLQELVGKPYADPWAGSRARGANTACGACGAYNFNAVEGQAVHAAFQNQVNTVFPISRAVVFPTVQYATWKRIAVQGRGMKGIYYFTYVPGTNPPQYRRNGIGTARPLHYWVNNRGAGARLGAGFYFFDTIGGADPQLVGGSTDTSVLAPGISWNAAEFGGDFLMSGFVYLNIQQYRSTGGGNAAPLLRYNMPGEIYRDVGHRLKSTGSNAWQLDSTGGFATRGAGDGAFSFQDLNNNGRFDVVVNTVPTTIQSNENGAVTNRTVFLPKTWRDDAFYGTNCTIPPADGSMPAVSACSEPHEPYLNFIYPDNRDGAATVGWEPYATQTRRPRDLIGATAVPNCATDPERCTSNGYDGDGALVQIPAILNGILYNEGTYSSQGNVDYCGSVLIRGNAGATGNANVWFDEKLIKGNWAPAGMPRVIVYSSMTDEQ